MLLTVTLALTLSAAAPSLAQPDFQTANVAPDVARFCQEHLATELSARGLRVVTSREIESMLGMERQKQLIGCADDSTSCMTELANALGTDGILLGDLGKIGSRYQLNIKVMSSKDAQLLATYRKGIDSEDDLLAELTRAAETLVPELNRKLRGDSGVAAKQPVAEVVAPEAPRIRRVPLVPTVIGGGALVLGGVLHLFAVDAAARLSNPERGPIEDGAAVRDRGAMLQTAAQVGYGLAGAALLTSAFLYARGEPAPLSAVVTPNGGALVLSGALP